MPRGPLMIIGGAEDKVRRRRVLKDFVAAAGGTEATVAVIPTASALGHEIVEVYDAVFRAEGVAEVVVVDPASREEAHDEALVRRLDKVSGVFMTGGNQLKLSALVCGTPLAEAIVAAHERGAVVGGTSAGASIQSSHMIAMGVGGSTPKQRMTQMAAGLGLLPGVVIDQHFEQRNRYGRLLTMVAQSPQLLGMGVDEDTAAVVEAGVLRVVGRGAVTIMDPSRITTNAFDAKRSAPLLASGVVLHVLPQGARFDLSRRELLPYGVDVDPLGAAELEQAVHDLGQMARDVAAADASPGALRRRLMRRRRQSPPARPADPTDGDDR